MTSAAEAVGPLHSQKDRVQRAKSSAYMVPEGGVLHGVLGSQRDAAEQDEEEDQVGEDCVIDDAVTLEAEPVCKEGRGKKRHERWDTL